MPLIQWIMQNLSPTAIQKEGVVVGGTADVAKQSYIIPKPAGLLAGGGAFYSKISNIIASGGIAVGGNAIVSKRSTKYKEIKHIPGDTVYDKCNKSWVVVSFEFAPSGEPKFNLSNSTGQQKILYESQLSDQPVYVLGEGFLDCPMAQSQVFSGRRIQKFGSIDLSYEKEMIESKINHLHQEIIPSVVNPGKKTFTSNYCSSYEQKKYLIESKISDLMNS